MENKISEFLPCPKIILWARMSLITSQIQNSVIISLFCARVSFSCLFFLFFSNSASGFLPGADDL